MQDIAIRADALVRIAVRIFNNVRWLSTGRAKVLAISVTLLCTACATRLDHLPHAPDDGILVLSPTTSILPESRDQSIARWIDPHDAGYRVSVLTLDQQRKALNSLIARYYGAPATTAATIGTSETNGSVWSASGIAPRTTEAASLRRFGTMTLKFNRYGPTSDHPGFGANLREHSAAWIEHIRRNADLDQFAHATGFQASRREITIDNALLRELPTDDPYFYDPRLPGEGYPFDNLAVTGLRPATPVYILGQTRDRKWVYALTPDAAGWMHRTALADVDDRFVAEWREAARHRLGAVIHDDVSIIDAAGRFRFLAPIGTMLPMLDSIDEGDSPSEKQAQEHVEVIGMIPISDSNGHAVWRRAAIDAGSIAVMPLPATPASFATIMQQLQGRPYVWGGSSNGNDCSLELKSLFTAFGIYLPRHSSAQVEGPGMITFDHATINERLRYLIEHGHPFLTIIYIGGHVMLYVGNSIVDGKTVPVVYEDVWGLSPENRDRRAIIGESVILPLLDHVADDPTLVPQAGGPIFRVRTVSTP